MADHEDFAASVRRICGELAEMLIAKNRAYGDSALQPVRIFSQASDIEQIQVRLDDKLSRIRNAARTGVADNEDAEKDLIGYLILKRIARERQGEP